MSGRADLTDRSTSRRIEVALPGRAYTIHVGGGAFARLAEWLAPLRATRLCVVSNATVDGYYGAAVREALVAIAPTDFVLLPDGEKYKTMDTAGRVLDALVDAGADRKSVVVALGGGVIGDVAGFAASVYMRGIRFVQLPTTLLAQVDSSVGGKTGVNHARGKNLIGTFHQPALVVTDTATLKTLAPRELSAGLAEIIKHGQLADAAYFDAVAQALPRLRACDPDALTQTVVGSCRIKAGIVVRDETESGDRALLNLGHTFGHAIEALTGFGTWLHGEAVGCGLCLAADLSARCGLIDAATVARIEEVVAAAGLPVRIEGLSRDAAIAAMRGDKKSEAGRIRFVLLERIGRAVQREAPDALLRATLDAGGYR
jgi:3-dehydroquinate synthase